MRLLGSSKLFISTWIVMLSVVTVACALAPHAARSEGKGLAFEPLGETVGVYGVADPGAPTVTSENLATRDSYWPYRVELMLEWTPTGADTPLAPRPGILVRVNRNGSARVDFAGAGIFDVPIEATDLVEAADQIRLGLREKRAPNVVLKIGNKLIDAQGDRPAIHSIPRNTPIDAVLCVYVDPASESLIEIRDALSPLTLREDLQIVLFPESPEKDLAVGRRLRQIDFKVPFVRSRYAAAYSRSFRGPAGGGAYLQLMTPDGRLLLEGGWEPDLFESISAVLATES